MKTKNLITIILSAGLVIINHTPSLARNLPSGMKIWFNQPAVTWNDALPVGNGKLGAMVFGGVEKERLELNEESLWTGQPRWDANPAALKNLSAVRQLLFSGKYKEAEELAQKGILGSKPQSPGCNLSGSG